MVTEEEIKKTVEYRWRGGQVKAYLGLWAVLVGIIVAVMLFSTAFRGRDWDEQSLQLLGTAIAVMVGLYSLLILPFVLYFAWRQWDMRKNCGQYQRYRVKLDAPSTSWSYRRAVSYRVEFEPESGGKIARQTKPIFSSAFTAQFQLSDYNNQTVEIFYDPERDEVILADKV